MYSFDDQDYQDSQRVKFEEAMGRKMKNTTFEMLLVEAANNAGQCLEDDKLDFEENVELFDQYFQASLEGFTLELIEHYDE